MIIFFVGWAFSPSTPHPSYKIEVKTPPKYCSTGNFPCYRRPKVVWAVQQTPDAIRLNLCLPYLTPKAGCKPVHASGWNEVTVSMEPPPRPRLQRSASARPAPLRRSGSLFQLLQRVPSFRNGVWGSTDDDYSSSGDEELHPPAPPSPAVSAQEAKVGPVFVFVSAQRFGDSFLVLQR